MAELATTHRGVVYPWQCDQMGHMNITFYTAKFDEATWQLFAMIGLTPSYLRDNRRGMAALVQKTSYKRELLAGDVVSVRSCVLSLRDKVIQFYHEMVNDETGEIAATTTITGVHMDLETRKSCPFPEQIIVLGQAMIPENKIGIQE